MPHFTTKFLKISTVLLISVFLFSGIKVDNKGYSSNDVLLVGEYNLQSTGNLNKNLRGTITFETSIEKTNSGTPFSTLKLKLDDVTSNTQHMMEFLISKENSSNEIPLGTYKVTKDIDGFLNYFDGVFGFANIKTLGEFPLFAQNGEIKIRYLDTKTAQGYIRMNLRNANGKSIHLKGSFLAKR